MSLEHLGRLWRRVTARWSRGWPFLASYLSLVLSCFPGRSFAEDAGCALGGSSRDRWPAKPIFSDESRIAASIADYNAQGCDWRIFAAAGRYRPGSDYLNFYQAIWNPLRLANVTNNPSGLILQTYDDGRTWVKQPQLMAQYALWLYSSFVHGNDLSPLFRLHADALLDMQREDGGVPFNFDLPDWTPPLKSGWIAGLAQSQAISVWVRAYKTFGEAKYLESARKAVALLVKPVTVGGCMGDLSNLDASLARFPIIQEYPGQFDNYTLNDACYAIIGLYDWSEYDANICCTLERLLESVRYLLPYYDLGGISSYDLRHLTQNILPQIDGPYHMFNVALVWTLDSIAPNPVYRRTWRTWAQQVYQPLLDTASDGE